VGIHLGEPCVPYLADMGPVLVTEHGAAVHSVFVGLGVGVAGLVLRAQVRRAGPFDERLLVVVAGTLVGGALGMRAAGLVRYVSDVSDVGSSTVADAWRYGAKSVLGGLAGAYAGALVGKRLAGYDRPTGDLFAPAVACGMAVGRLGCFLTEPLGRPMWLPWSVRGLHPSFLYEIGFHVLAFAALLRLRGRVGTPGALLTLYLAAYAGFRFLVEFTRANQPLGLGLTGSQWFVLAAAPLLALKLWRTPLRRAPAGAMA
jgi:prolipoprotein diacylglyceryltransferase